MMAGRRLRFEYKYRLGQSAYYRVLNAIRPWCRPDAYSESAPSGRYLVRSLYYDRPDYSAYTDKMEGVFNRDKLRIRTYVPVRAEVDEVKVEVKRRVGLLIHKLSQSVDIADYDSFVRTGEWGRATGAALDAFSYEYHIGQMAPTVIVEYRREAYIGLVDNSVRFSFDHEVQYAWSGKLFKPDSAFKADLDGSVIFEVKVAETDIAWVNEIIRQVGIVSEPNSKFAKAFELTSTDVWT